MKRLIKILEKIRKWFKDTKYDFGYSFYNPKNGFGKKIYWFWFLWHVWGYLKSEIKVKYCDHHFIDEGYANANSGCIDMVCKKCGWSPGKTVLY